MHPASREGASAPRSARCPTGPACRSPSRSLTGSGTSRPPSNRPWKPCARRACEGAPAPVPSTWPATRHTATGPSSPTCANAGSSRSSRLAGAATWARAAHEASTLILPPARRHRALRGVAERLPFDRHPPRQARGQLRRHGEARHPAPVPSDSQAVRQDLAPASGSRSRWRWSPSPRYRFSALSPPSEPEDQQLTASVIPPSQANMAPTGHRESFSMIFMRMDTGSTCGSLVLPLSLNSYNER